MLREFEAVRQWPEQLGDFGLFRRLGLCFGRVRRRVFRSSRRPRIGRNGGSRIRTKWLLASRYVFQLGSEGWGVAVSVFSFVHPGLTHSGSEALPRLFGACFRLLDAAAWPGLCFTAAGGAVFAGFFWTSRNVSCAEHE